MKNLRKTLIDKIKKMSDKQVKAINDVLRETLQKSAATSIVSTCPYCGGGIVKNGTQCGRQRHKCKSCGRTFTCTVNTIQYRSKADRCSWEEVITDTFKFVPIDETADKMGFTHDRVFRMRHKILAALKNMEDENPSEFPAVNECDETYVLESLKGSKMPEGYWREARAHGAKAQKRGISNEYVCICTGVGRGGGAVAVSLNRAKPDATELKEAFDGYLNENTLVICDGLKSYCALNASYGCPVKDINVETDKFFNLNSVNGFHSFIKEKYAGYRGVATIYLNRYNALFSKIYRAGKASLENLRNRLIDDNAQNNYFSVKTLKSLKLLAI